MAAGRRSRHELREELLERMNPCPLCLDISYTDADGVEHELFDLCEIHRNVHETCESFGVRHELKSSRWYRSLIASLSGPSSSS